MKLKKILLKIRLPLILFYLLALYKLVITPAVLDWSSLGVLLAIAVIGLLFLSLPEGKRIHYLVLGTAFLMANQAIGNLKQVSAIMTAAGYVSIFVVIYVVIRLLGKVSLSKFTVVFLTALLANLIFYPAEYPLWTEFAVKWRSPVLYPKGVIDYFPVQVADVDGKTGEEIIVQGNPARAEKPAQDESSANQGLPLAGDEETTYFVYAWDGKTFVRLPQSEYSVPAVAKALQKDFPNFPYYGVGFKNSSAGVEQVLTPLFKPETLIEEAMDFGRAPFKALVQDLESIRYFEGSWQSFAQYNKIDSKIAVNQARVLGSTDFVAGDVEADGRNDLMVNAEYAKIINVTPQGGSKVLWTSPDESFRFEAFSRLGEAKTPYIIARSKSQFRQNKARYITAYHYTPAGLDQKWRVFADLTGITPGDIDGDGENELVGYLPDKHIVFVLEKHGLPVAATLYILTGGIILYGFYRKFGLRKAQHEEVG